MSSDATLRVHFAKMTALSIRIAAWIFKSSRTMNKNTMLLLRAIFVLSRLDCRSQLWSPKITKFLAEREAIQHHFTKKIDLGGTDELLGETTRTEATLPGV